MNATGLVIRSAFATPTSVLIARSILEVADMELTVYTSEENQLREWGWTAKRTLQPTALTHSTCPSP